MAQKKERKHKIKQANTLETSKKTLQKALMSALHNGGFLFARKGDGLMTPVIVNARISDIATSVIPFAVSRANTTKELTDLRKYFVNVLDRACKLREIDIAEMSGVTETTEELEARSKGNTIPLDIHMDAPDGSSEG